MRGAEQRIRAHLFSLADDAYRDFQSSLIPNIEKLCIIGVRMPHLRALAKQLKDTEDAAEFLAAPAHAYYDEKMLHALLIEHIQDPDALETALDAFLPHVDNWATCDALSLKILKKYPEKRMKMAKKYLFSPHPYTMRLGIGILMRHELGESFTPDVLRLVAQIASEEYYVKMMQAWFFATALAFRYEEALPYLLEKTLTPWVHQRTIRKAIESFRISDEKKAFLRTLSAKNG